MADLNRYAALAAILKELGVDLQVSGMDSRIQMQKAIYLAQVGGVDLGYRFNWYVRGPYSPPLADDYYEAIKRSEVKNFVASEDLRNRLEPVRTVLADKPKSVSSTDWLEATASLDYIWRVQRRPFNELESAFMTEKPRLYNLFEKALNAIKNLPRD